ncbi:MAG: FAD:protein FMN transferase, partial [Clostridia bacterium]|nr:FAD:protein FMN transferase [Clostridia bacterium]
CVAIVCDDGALADALSTACFVMGYERTMELYNKEIYDFEAVFVTESGVEYTPGIKDKLTLK